MLRASTLTTHGAVLAVSAAAHAAVFVAVVGHPRAPAAAPVDDRAAEVDVALDLRPAPVSAEDFRESVAAAPAFPWHTHSYPVPASHDWTPHDPALVHLPVPSPAPHVDAPPPSPSPDAPATPALTAEALPHFTLAAGPASHPGGAPGDGHPGGVPGGDPQGDGVAAEQSVSMPARLVQGPPPAYPTAARSQGVEADVPLELVVSRAGAVESARVIGHAGFGFDESALEAIRAYRFSPAIRDGQPTRVRMRWTMQFRLR
jgi:protein TonB